jgi:hypothetical protein
MHRIPEQSGRDMTIIIPTIDLSAGIYFLILDFDGFRTVRKFVKR